MAVFLAYNALGQAIMEDERPELIRVFPALRHFPEDQPTCPRIAPHNPTKRKMRNRFGVG